MIVFLLALLGGTISGLIVAALTIWIQDDKLWARIVRWLQE